MIVLLATTGLGVCYALLLILKGVHDAVVGVGFGLAGGAALGGR